MRRLSRAALALASCWLAGAHAQERSEERGEPRERSRVEEQPAAPDLDFLEYLGAWAEEDDEWLAIETWEQELGQDADKDPKGVENERDDDDESE